MARACFAASLALSLWACDSSSETVNLSELPPSMAESQSQPVQSQSGRFSLRAYIAYDDIASLIDTAMPAAHPVSGTKQLCKRILGFKACGTGLWDLDITRTGPLEVGGSKNSLLITSPLSFKGDVGVEGKVAKALGLSTLDTSGDVDVEVSIALNLNESWCPDISTSVSYAWTNKPTLVWKGNFDFSLESIVNDALDKQLAGLDERIRESIDCADIRKQITPHWRNYTLPIELPSEQASTGDSNLETDALTADNLHLNIEPSDFSFSGIRTDEKNLGFGFAIDASMALDTEPLTATQHTLPTLKPIEFGDNMSHFDILLRANYTQLQQVVEPKLVGKTYTSETIAGKVSVTIQSVALNSNPDGLTVSLGFTAKLPGKRNDTNGTLHLMAMPTVDVENQKLILKNIRMTKILDSTLWNVLSSVFEGQIIEAIERNAEIDYSERLAAFATKVKTQLEDPSRMNGAIFTVKQFNVELLDIIPESTSLAAQARVIADLELDLPLSLLKNSIKQ